MRGELIECHRDVINHRWFTIAGVADALEHSDGVSRGHGLRTQRFCRQCSNGSCQTLVVIGVFDGTDSIGVGRNFGRVSRFIQNVRGLGCCQDMSGYYSVRYVVRFTLS